MRYDTVITVEQFEEDREKSDSDVWSDYEVFEESRDMIPLRELVAETVEGQFTHPSNWHSSMTLQDAVESVTMDYVDVAVPEGIPSEVEKNFSADVRDEISEHAEPVYKGCMSEADEAESVSEIQEIIDQEMDEQEVPENY